MTAVVMNPVNRPGLRSRLNTQKVTDSMLRLSVETEGGPFDVHGPMLVDDMLFVVSGYESFGQKEGNAFLAFRLKR